MTNNQFGWCKADEKTRELEDDLEVLQALLATILHEYSDIELWSIHASDMENMPRNLERVVEKLKRLKKLNNNEY